MEGLSRHIIYQIYWHCDILSLMNLAMSNRHYLATLASASVANCNKRVRLSDMLGPVQEPSTLIVRREGKIKQLADKLVLRLLVNDQEHDTHFDESILLSSRGWIAPLAFLEQLTILCFPVELNKTDPSLLSRHRFRILALLSRWMCLHPYDFTGRRSSRLLHACLELLNLSCSAAVATEVQALKAQWTGTDLFSDWPTEFPESIAFSSNGSTLRLTDISPMEAARQLTLLIADVVMGLELRNVNVWATTRKSSIMAQFEAFRSRFLELLLSEGTPADRCRYLVYLLQLAEEFLNLRNYQGLMIIMATTCHQNVKRLKRAWNLLPEESALKFKSFRVLLEKGCMGIRDAQESASPPSIPYLSFMVADASFAQEMAVRNWRQRELLNVGRMTALARALKMLISRDTHCRYVFKRVEPIAAFFLKPCMMDEEQMLESSLRL